MLMPNMKRGGPVSGNWRSNSSVKDLSDMYLPSFTESPGGKSLIEMNLSKPSSLNAMVRFQKPGLLPCTASVV